MTAALATPSLDLARHATRELEYAERFIIHSMNPATGSHEIISYSLPAAAGALFGVDWEGLLADGSKLSFGWVDIAEFARWVRDVIGDPELAAAIEAQALPQECYRDQLEAMEPLVLGRLAQYREAVAE